MPSRFENAVVTALGPTPTTAPAEVPLGFAGGILRQFSIVIPDGHAGLTGIALGYGHRAVIPYTSGAYFSGNDETITRDYADQVPGVAWSAFVVNLDIQVHVWEVRFAFDELDVSALRASPAVIPASDITAAGDAALTGP